MAINIFWILSKNILEFSNLSFTLQFYLQYKHDWHHFLQERQIKTSILKVLYFTFIFIQRSSLVINKNPPDYAVFICKRSSIFRKKSYQNYLTPSPMSSPPHTHTQTHTQTHTHTHKIGKAFFRKANYKTHSGNHLILRIINLIIN